MALHDAQQRQQATDPTHSYIVQAPAGSGKTELLTQRYLRLLGLVTAPEQIVALTFTKKAANEMRERIIMALQQAARGDLASSPHQQQTLAYAQLALSRDKHLDWNLLQQPGRLRVITIDSLCQKLSHAIPLQDQQLSFPQISEQPDRLYLEAATACLHSALEQAPLQPAIQVLLKLVDNRQDALITLFIDLLAQRDQWMAPLYHAKHQEKDQLEAALAWIERHELNRFKSTLPTTLHKDLIGLARYAATVENDPESPRYLLRDWQSIEQLNGSIAASLASLLLTTQQTLRKAFDHHVGIKRGRCDDHDYETIKSHSKLLLATLDVTPGFLEALCRIKQLPNPHYNDEQWQALQALFLILPLLVAHLQLVFNQHNQVDFTAISQQALDALGSDDNPTDLALHLDNAIHHLLVDEFQDTSIQQFQLLTKLVCGWQPNDGKTLFVVGDPMQSIYRFRAAEVGLFLRAKTHGIGPVQLSSLHLCCNFRSSTTLVEWINQQFQRIFPPSDDIESGAVSFYPSVATRDNLNHSHITALECSTREEEAQQIVAIARADLTNFPDDTLAILVRSRSQLSALLTELRMQQIPFQGVDIDLLADLPHLRDVWSITQALLMPANRLSWLTVLRSPWCGLSLQDLLHLATFNRHLSLPETLAQLDKIPSLSHEGRYRCQFIARVLQDALTQRHQHSLVDWVLNTLKALHLDHVLDPQAQEDLEQYWLLLERFEQDGQLPDLQQFYQALTTLYSQQITPSRLHIMTIHKSKGLEFDGILLPGLSKNPPPLDKPLLRWLELPRDQSSPLLLMSPIKAAHQENCLLYDYLGKLHREKNDYEIQRLLYVAATRARKRLYLTDHQNTAGRSSFRSLLRHPFDTLTTQTTDKPESTKESPLLHRLPLSYYQTPPKQTLTSYATSELKAIDSTPRLIGIVIHEVLQQLCTWHPVSLPMALIDQRLQALGLTGDTYRHAQQTIQQQLQQLLECPVGQWIIQPHLNERNEYELLITDQGETATRIIDRTFEDHGIRWIIDFKTGQDHPEQQTKHRQQVNDYAKLLRKQYPEGPIHCGLYYLSSNRWLEWAHIDQQK